MDRESLTPDEREHVTKVYYFNPDRFCIRNMASLDPSMAGISHCVDKVEDIGRVERILLEPDRMNSLPWKVAV
jgi:spore coat polysaccharide biosynthesis protein SpsF (cytidylyltransferase family)